MNAHSSIPVKLEEPAAIPPSLLGALNAYEGLLRGTTCTESLVRDGPLTSIADALTEHLRGQRIHGYHCTREPEPGYFAARGLRATNLAEHQEEFLRALGHHFTAGEIAYMHEQWGGYFDEGQRRGREGRVWACLTRALVLSHGAEPFFEAYGGEAIYMPLADNSSSKRKLTSLGQPVVVEVALPGAEIRTSYEMAWCAMNYHHRRINPSAHAMESEACFKGGVPPADVLAVVPLSEFRVRTVGGSNGHPR